MTQWALIRRCKSKDQGIAAMGSRNIIVLEKKMAEMENLKMLL